MGSIHSRHISSHTSMRHGVYDQTAPDIGKPWLMERRRTGAGATPADGLDPSAGIVVVGSPTVKSAGGQLDGQRRSATRDWCHPIKVTAYLTQQHKSM